MKATLSFNLDDPDDVKSHARCLAADDLCYVLSEMATLLRNRIKHGLLEDRCQQEVRLIHAELFDEMRDRGIDLERIWG